MVKVGDQESLLRGKNYLNGFLILQNLRTIYSMIWIIFLVGCEKVKVMQKNWIGKSLGCEINFKVSDQENTEINVFTTRPDTIFGASFIAFLLIIH